MNLKKRTALKKEQFRMLHTDPSLFETMGEKIISWFPTIPRDYVVVCIGTDRSTGDSLGPLTGSFFSDKKPKHMTIYGTLHEPVHATNLEKYIMDIKEKHRDPYIIAVDACLGRNASVGCLITGLGPLMPGAALNKPLPSIGDVHITGVVNIGGFMEHSVLQNTRLSVVVDMANKIADLLDILDQRLIRQHTIPAIVSSHLQQSINSKKMEL